MRRERKVQPVIEGLEDRQLLSGGQIPIPALPGDIYTPPRASDPVPLPVEPT